MSLSYDQRQLVARLKDEPGYVLLCDALQAEIDEMASFLAAEDDPTKAEGKRQEWRAARRLLAVIKTRPEQIAGELAAEEEAGGRPEVDADHSETARLRAAFEQSGQRLGPRDVLSILSSFGNEQAVD